MEGEITKTLIESQYPLWEIILLFILIQLIIVLCSEWIKKLIEKQAISGITNKIKEIETKFTNQTEALKSQLSLLTNVKSEIYSTERNAIINANEKLYQWLSHIMRLPTLDDNDDIDRYIKKMDDLYQEEQSSEALLELFIDDKSIIDNIHKISGYIYNLHIKKQIILFKLKKQNSDSELNESSLKELEYKTREILSELINQYEKISPRVHELRLDFKNYIYSKCLNIKPEA
jgi:hypothetical protein